MAGHWSDRIGTTGSPRARVTGEGWLSMLGLSDRDLRRARTLLAVTGVLSVLAGVAAIVVPAAASVAMSVFLGWLLVFAGALMGIHAFSRHSRDRMAMRLLNAVLTLAVGLYLLILPLSGAITLTVLLAVWFFGIGALELLAAWRARGLPGVGLMAFHGGVSLVLGLLIAVSQPSSAAWAIGLLVGVNLIMWGLRALVLAMALGRLHAA
jgi:uncharacterized membrane protein HdeD (DUF308 family)